MENIIIRNIKKKDIPSVVDIQIDGWKLAYRGIIALYYYYRYLLELYPKYNM